MANVRSQQGIQSVEVGARLLKVLAHHRRPMMLKDLAQEAEMPPAKAHRYLVSFIRTGLVEKDEPTGRYGLGSFSLDLGLACLITLDPVRLATPILDDLCEQINETVALAVWGTHGPTIVRLAEAGGVVTVTVRAGTVLPVLNSATGRIFAACHKSVHTKQMVDAALEEAARQSGKSLKSVSQEFSAILDEVGTHGYSRSSGSITPGINGFSAPVYDHSGRMVAAITSLGTIGHFDADWDSPIALAILKASAALSERLGYVAGQTVE